jgi:hypothetical protein
MKTLFQILVFSILSFSAIAQQASEIDPKFVKLPRYADLTAITTAIAAPTQGMLVYNIGTASNWYYNGSAWTNSAGSLALPFSQTQAEAGTLFNLINTGTGNTSRFTINNSSNANNAFSGTTNGTGRAGHFTISNPINTNFALSSVHTGLGRAADFTILNTANTDRALSVSSNGLGQAGSFTITNPSNTSNALFASTDGTGIAIRGQTNTGQAGFFEIGSSSNIYNSLESRTYGTGNAFFASNLGIGQAGSFNINNVANSNYAISALTNGTGKAAYFQGTNALETDGTIKFGGSGVGTPAVGKILTSGDALGNAQWQELVPYTKSVVSASTLFNLTNFGTGRVGNFQINNVANSFDALTASTNGTGAAIFGSTTGSGEGINGQSQSDNGMAGLFQNVSSTNTASTILSRNQGLGHSGFFFSTNPLNPVEALVAVNYGSGSGFYTTSNGLSSTIIAQNNSTGRALDTRNNSASFATARFVNNNISFGNAIELEGGIRVIGTNKAAFKIVTSAPFIAANKFGIQNTTLANASTDILYVTNEYTGGSYLNKQFATFWNGGNWEIHLTDGTAMPVGITFNVLVIKQ